MSSAKADEKAQTAIVEAGRLATTLKILQSLADEAIIHIGNHGIRTSLVDAANHAMHDPLELDSGAFEHVPEGSFVLGVKLERLEDMLPTGGGELAELSLNTETRMLNVVYDNVDVNVACIDPDSIRDPPETPDLDLPNEFTVGSDEWEKAIKTADKVTDHVAVECLKSEGVVVVRGEGDIDDVEIEFGDDELIDDDIREDSLSLFSLDYLEDVVKPIPSGGEVTVACGSEMPIWMDFDFADGHGSVRTMLAPRIKKD